MPLGGELRLKMKLRLDAGEISILSIAVNDASHKWQMDVESFAFISRNLEHILESQKMETNQG